MADNPLQTVAPDGAPGGDVVRDQDKIMLVLAYLSILALVPLLTVKDSEYVKWHAKQGLVLTAAMFAMSLVMTVVSAVLPIGICAFPLLTLGGIALTVYAIIQALKPVRWRIPVLADLADKF